MTSDLEYTVPQRIVSQSGPGDRRSGPMKSGGEAPHSIEANERNSSLDFSPVADQQH